MSGDPPPPGKRRGELDPIAWGYRGRPHALIKDMFEGALALLGPMRPIQVAQLRLRTIEFLREEGYLAANWPMTLEGSESALDIVDAEAEWRIVAGLSGAGPPRQNARPHARRETSVGPKSILRSARKETDLTSDILGNASAARKDEP